MKATLTLAALLLVACNNPGCQPTPSPSPNPPPVPPSLDAGPIGASYTAACGHLAELGCPEGTAGDCASVMQRADKAHLVLVPIQCLITARSKDDVHGCGGFVRCP